MKEIIILLVLILVNGVLSMSEIALISSRKSMLKNRADSGNRKANVALKLFNDPDKFLSTVQIGITLIGILTGIYSGDVLATDFSTILNNIGVSQQYSFIIAQTIIVIAVTYLSLVLGELVPKRIGMNASEKVAIATAVPMNLLAVTAAPFVKLLSKSTAFILRLTGIKNPSNGVTEEEIISMIKEGRRGGEVQQVEEDIMERVFLLGDLKAESLMTHSKDVVCLYSDMSLDDIIPVLDKSTFNIFPLFDKKENDIIGIVSLKDIVIEIQSSNFDLKKITKPAIYIHENLDVYKSLQMMREKKRSHLLVCDEFGSFRGLITLRDIMEGLVGAIGGNVDDPTIVKRKDTEEWLVDGQMPFYDFLSYFEKEQLYGTKNYNTIAGLILNQLEHIPQTGEKLSWENFDMEIADMDGARIDKVAVKLNKSNSKTSDSQEEQL